MEERIKHAVLEVFATSATSPIYALRNSVPLELFGAFGSYFSRNPKDLRDHLWDAITGQIEDEGTDFDEDSLDWLISGDFREPYEAIRQGIAQSQNFFKRWYGKYSHKSIANTVWIPMVGTNVSQLFAKELAYDQLAFFIEQSTRFVKFDGDNIYLDKDVMNSPLSNVYKDSLQQLSSCYDKLTEIAISHYTKETSFEDWLGMQTGQTLKMSDRGKRIKYNREIKGKALDVSRFLLPQAVKTNLAWILDARSTEFDIAAWKGHPLNELREGAMLIEEHAGQIAPSLLKYTKENGYYGDKLRNYHGDLIIGNDEQYEFGKGATVVSYERDALNKTIAHILKRHNRGGTFGQRYFEVKKMSFSEKIDILDRITSSRGPRDEWVEMDEDFDLVNITVEIRTDVGATRDWRRHQKWSRGEPLYTLDNGVHRPFMLYDMPEQAGIIFDKSIEISHQAEQRIKMEFPHQAQYVIPMAAMHSITMSSGLDQLQYMLYTRTTPEGNFSYRADAFNLAEAVIKVHPWLLGYEHYPEDKEFLKVYEDAPLKKLFPLQFGDTELHQ